MHAFFETQRIPQVLDHQASIRTRIRYLHSSLIRPHCFLTCDEPRIHHPFHPSQLAAICHSWRELALSIPDLWASISITPYKRNFSYINRCLEWACQSPLFIELYVGGGVDDLYDPTLTYPEARDAIALVKQNLHRIAYLCLSLPQGFIAALASKSTQPDAAPLLEEFHIHDIDQNTEPCSIDIDICANLPRPRKIAASHYLVSKVHLDWFRVSQLVLSFGHMDSLAGHELLDLLSMG